MDVRVKVMYEDGRNKIITVQIRDGLTGTDLLNALDIAVDKVMIHDLDWSRVSVLEVIK